MGKYHRNALPLGYELSDYVIDAVLGHGGFGVTYLARDTKLGALVAIKEFLPGELSRRDNTNMRVLPNPERNAVRDYHIGLKNFVREARALAHFKHPHIVRVLRFLEANGTAYMVMEYEEGQSVADYLKRQGPQMDEATILRVFIPILNGLHAVHEAKMLHLDIKPENIYLRQDGTPILIDFGSARRAMTETGGAQRVALTPGYAPIEQYPEKGSPGPWTDVYGLGAAMYRCVSGKRPDDSLTRYQAVLKYQTDPLMPATKTARNRYQPMLLECVDWSMQIHAKDRPQSARELQDALMGKRRPVASSSSKPVNPLVPPKSVALPSSQTFSRDLKRVQLRACAKAVLAAGRMLLAIAIIGAALIATGLYWDEIMARFAPHHTLTELSAPEPVNTDPVTKAKPVPTTSGAPSAPVAGIEPAPIAPERTLNAHKDWVQSLAFSPDGKWIATGSIDRTVKVWDVASGALIATLGGHAGAINAVTYSPDGKWLATAGNDGVVKLWDGITRAQRETLRGSGGSLFAIAFSPDSTLLAASGRDRTIWLWNIVNSRRVATLDGHKGEVFALAFAPDGHTLASAGADKTIRFWDRQSHQERSMLSTHNEAVLALAYSADGRWLASGDAGKTLRLWDARTLVPVRTSVNAGHSVLSLAFSPHGHWLAAASADKTVTLFEGSDRIPMHTLSGHQDYVQSVAFSPDGRWLASGSRDHSVRLWKAR